MYRARLFVDHACWLAIKITGQWHRSIRLQARAQVLGLACVYVSWHKREPRQCLLGMVNPHAGASWKAVSFQTRLHCRLRNSDPFQLARHMSLIHESVDQRLNPFSIYIDRLISRWENKGKKACRGSCQCVWHFNRHQPTWRSSLLAYFKPGTSQT